MSMATEADVERTGTFVTATSHIITAVIGSGVLSLAWATAQLGWVAGTTVLILFAAVTAFTSRLLADCYRFPDPVTGTRNSAYIDCVRATLGGVYVYMCGIAQYSNLIGTTIGYTITASDSMVAIGRSDCFHKHGHQMECQVEIRQFVIIFGAIQILLSQIQNFSKLSFLSVIAALMSVTYSFIGFGLSIAKIAGGDAHIQRNLTGTQDVWDSFAALGDMAFAFSFSLVLIEIQDTLRSSPPERIVMKWASFTAISVSTVFYLLCGLSGYAAFGSAAPGNLLTGFGFYEPFWLVDLGNVCVIIHLIGAYQVYCQPIFAFVESWTTRRWPESRLVSTEKVIYLPYGRQIRISIFRVLWRSLYVILTTAIAILFPFFNYVTGLLGALSFWPSTVYFPVEMYIVQFKIARFSYYWLFLKTLSLISFVISMLAAAASLKAIVVQL